MSIANILSKYQVSDILSKLGISYIEKSETLVACCPYHSEKTPSFSIYKNSGHFTCFGCGKKGSIYDLVKDLTNNNIYSYLGVENSIDDAKVHVARDFKEKKLKDVELIVEGDLLNVFSNQFVLDYCWSIGLTNEFIETFNVSYAKVVKIYPPGTEERKRKAFYNRIIIPCVYDKKIYNYECRDYTKRSSRKVLYPIGSEPDILFNYDNIKKDEVVFITEGIKGLSTIWSFYSKNVVSTFGKTVKEHQQKLIRELPYICVVPDNDENKIDKKTNLPVDNIKSTLEVYETIRDGEFEIAYIPYKGKDPNNLTRTQLKQVLDARKFSNEILNDREWPKEDKNDYFKEGLI